MSYIPASQPPVVPWVVDHDPAIVEADAEDEGVVQDPVHHGGHLGLPLLEDRLTY